MIFHIPFDEFSPQGAGVYKTQAWVRSEPGSFHQPIEHQKGDDLRHIVDGCDIRITIEWVFDSIIGFLPSQVVQDFFHPQ